MNEHLKYHCPKCKQLMRKHAVMYLVGGARQSVTIMCDLCKIVSAVDEPLSNPLPKPGSGKEGE